MVIRTIKYFKINSNGLLKLKYLTFSFISIKFNLTFNKKKPNEQVVRLILMT